MPSFIWERGDGHTQFREIWGLGLNKLNDRRRRPRLRKWRRHWKIQNEAVEVLKKLTRAEAVVASKKARAAETSKEEMKQYRHRRKRGFAVLRKETAMESVEWSQKGRYARKTL